LYVVSTHSLLYPSRNLTLYILKYVIIRRLIDWNFRTGYFQWQGRETYRRELYIVCFL